MHDVLQYASRDPVHRRWNHNELTFSMIYAYTENFILPFSHDEVVHGKRSMLDKLPGDEWQKRATLRTLFAFMFMHPGKKLLFMGAEFGQWREWNHDTSLDWHLLEQPGHAGLQRVVQDLNRLYRDEPALHRRDHHHEGFRWIDCSDNENSIVSVLRTAGDPADHFVGVFNFTPVPRYRYTVGVPACRLLPRSAQHRQSGVRRKRRRQPWRAGRDAGQRARLRPVPAPDRAAAWRRAARPCAIPDGRPDAKGTSCVKAMMNRMLLRTSSALFGTAGARGVPPARPFRVDGPLADVG